MNVSGTIIIHEAWTSPCARAAGAGTIAPASTNPRGRDDRECSADLQMT